MSPAAPSAPHPHGTAHPFSPSRLSRGAPIHGEGKPKETLGNQSFVFKQPEASWEPSGCLGVLLPDAVGAGQGVGAGPGHLAGGVGASGSLLDLSQPLSSRSCSAAKPHRDSHAVKSHVFLPNCSTPARLQRHFRPAGEISLEVKHRIRLPVRNEMPCEIQPQALLSSS